ncbi:MAG: sigma-70 family RNA polymerase sigma factor [bacterium]|nr:sigma-70 family RNA polymerase sigma factor [bacterium]
MKSVRKDPEYWLDEHAPRLLAYARQWAGSSGGAEDIFQDAFVRFWRKKGSVRDPVTYLYRCVRTTAMNSMRSRKRREGHEAGSIPPRSSDDPHTIVELSERRMLIENALAGLPLDQREVVVMKIWGEMTFSQIGEVMSLPRSTVHATYGVAMTRLHEKLRTEK